MKLPNWFKIGWWVVLLIGLTLFLVRRYNDLVAGKSTGTDILVLVVWLALLLFPLFHEISLFGVTFKREVETLKTEVKGELSNMRAEIRNSLEVRNHFSPNLYFQQAPPDAQLSIIGKSIQAELRGTSKVANATVAAELTAPADAELLFRARYNIERELRRIWQQHLAAPPNRRFLPTLRIAQLLVEWELVPASVERAIRDVWLVASPAIHGEPVTVAKVEFVRDVTPGLVETLKGIP
jgi:hypothetical protein